ncbi:hypothetical protein [Nonomuraea aridisoli]|uniref:Uncharacterized protein n=1 Tax=Nonomuraea aridisoli TaxID=2070368 RepID=A0A2W2EDB2_9ACTN|nr:hypothetical protein [Nonomuraea aridisoli]PZG09938.1 hypothetical protein C1J01_36965 [Nonomuraea aridisoli]
MPRGTYARNTRGNEWVHEPIGFVIHPEDLVGAEPHPDPGRRSGCHGLDGLDGPNLVCGGCGQELGTRQADCFTQNHVTLDFAAVKRSFTGD